MVIWRSLDDVPSSAAPSVVTIGNFDGVHRGHQRVIAVARDAALRLASGPNQQSSTQPSVVAVTFDPHPFAVLRPEHVPACLTTTQERADLLAAAGADATLVLPFDAGVASWSPEEFVDRVLVAALGAVAVVVGVNFRFGRRAAGDVGTLTALGARHGFEVVAVDLAGDAEAWSSTYVRQRLAEGDVAAAAQALGRPYAVSGPVTRGDRRGRELGYPTANVALTPGLAAPADGVYAGWLTRADTGERYPAAISVGTNPTFEGVRTRRVEAYVLDRDDLDLYDAHVRVEFVRWLRGMVAFDGIDALQAAMAADVEEARRVLDAGDGARRD